jgi:hypothetical protein
LLIAFPNADDPPSGNHESLKSKIPKRKKARPTPRFPAKSNTYIKTTSAYFLGRSAFFTDDFLERLSRKLASPVAPEIALIDFSDDKSTVEYH